MRHCARLRQGYRRCVRDRLPAAPNAVEQLQNLF